MSILWSFGIPFTIINGILSLFNFEHGSINWKIGILNLCRVPFEVFVIVLLLYLYRNNFDWTLTITLPTILLIVVLGVYAAIRAGITHGGLKKGVIIEMNALFSDLVKEKAE